MEMEICVWMTLLAYIQMAKLPLHIEICGRHEMDARVLNDVFSLSRKNVRQLGIHALQECTKVC